MNKDKLIAEFMYWDINDPRTFPKTCQQPIYDGCWGDYRFDTSWDWLMPVVIKCFEVDDSVNDDLNFKLNDALLETNIDSLYKVVVEFIKNYKTI
jgi:hypothetical protein